MAKQRGNHQAEGEGAASGKSAKPAKPPREKRLRDPAMPWGPWLRAGVSCAVLFHLSAVFVPPWYLYITAPQKLTPALPPGERVLDRSGNDLPPDRWGEAGVSEQRPPLVGPLAWLMRHYANLLYINNGYEFFSPNPTISHVVEYEVLDESGQPVAKGRMPDLRDQWPRLFYHRHMMLVEQTQAPDHPLIGVEDTAGEWLCKKYGGESVRMTLRIHHLLTPQQILEGMRPEDESTYETVGSFTHRRGDVPRPNAAGESIPAPNTVIPGVSR